MENVEINSIQNMIEALEADNLDYLGPTWYRGHSNAAWQLLPGYYRLANAPPESTLIKRFKQSASMLISGPQKSSFDWLFQMQHYGVPTRLLDWSENPLIALYFAVSAETNDANTDAALWLLRPTELNKNANIRDPYEEYFIPSTEDEELINYSTETLRQNLRNQLKPVATIATRNNPRIQAQLGVFTIHHNDKIPIEDVGDSSHIIKYIIPGKSLTNIHEQLRLLGFSKFQLFPELSSIGEVIKGDLS